MNTLGPLFAWSEIEAVALILQGLNANKGCFPVLLILVEKDKPVHQTYDGEHAIESCNSAKFPVSSNRSRESTLPRSCLKQVDFEFRRQFSRMNQVNILLRLSSTHRNHNDDSCRCI